MTTRATRALLLLLMLSGCSFLKRPENHFYSLEVIPATTPVVQLQGTPVGIDGVELPPGLDRRDLFVRGANGAVEVRGTHQWTASLEEMVTHTLSFDLAGRVPDGMVVLPGQAKPQAMRSIYVTFQELAPGPEPVFVLDARWAIGPGGAAHHERISVPMASMESPEIAKAMSAAIAQLADRMAMQL
jgi:uncharacterized lipoprotein YmbA